MLFTGVQKKELPQSVLISLLSFHLRIESCDGAFISLAPSKTLAAAREIEGEIYTQLLAERSYRNATETISCAVEIYDTVVDVEFTTNNLSGPDEQDILPEPEPIEGALYVASQAVCEVMWGKGRIDFVCPGDLLGFETTRAKLPNGTWVPILRCLGLRRNK
jgi:hypothetical protein